MSLQDSKLQFYLGLGAVGATADEVAADYFMTQTGLFHREDAEREYLRSQGASGEQLDELWRDYLGQNGYTGTFTDMQTDFYLNGSFTPASADSLLLETGDYLLLESGDKLLLE